MAGMRLVKYAAGAAGIGSAAWHTAALQQKHALHDLHVRQSEVGMKAAKKVRARGGSREQQIQAYEAAISKVKPRALTRAQLNTWINNRHTGKLTRRQARLMAPGNGYWDHWSVDPYGMKGRVRYRPSNPYQYVTPPGIKKGIDNLLMTHMRSEFLRTPEVAKELPAVIKKLREEKRKGQKG